jgi:predicted signal transduction protein with EAL and GGDEF domain
LIAALSDLMISKACKDATNWTDGACLAVNISASLLGRGYLPDRIARALLESGLPAARLELEITETALLDDNERVLEELRTIQKMGVSIALDDFGTGYSSLSHLRAFPFQKIKIDGSFVRDAALNPNCAAIVHAIADLGKRLGVATVAEGVETLEQLEFVRSQGCQQVQGNFYSAPLPSEEDLPRIRALSNYDVSRGTLAASDRPDDFEPWHESSSRP